MKASRSLTLLFCCLLSSILGLESLQADCVSLTTGLIHWYRGEDDASDFFGTGSPTQTIGTLTFVAAKVGQGLKFDGTSGLIVPDSDTVDFDATQSFTIETWVRIDGTFANDSLLLDKRQSGGGLGYLVGLIGTNFGSETRKFYCVVQGGVTLDVRTAPVNDHAFHHLAVVLDRASSTMASYLDGVLQQTKNISGLSGLQNSGRLFLAHQSLDVPGTTGVALNGVLDELSFYNRALNSNEIAAIFAAGSAGKCPPPGAPSLTIFLTITNTVVVSWPAPSTGFVLQQNASLAPTIWTNTTDAISVMNDQNQILVSPPIGNLFYRLFKP